jgi:hypothetical protein
LGKEYADAPERVCESANSVVCEQIADHNLDLAQAIYTKMIPMLFMNYEWSYVDPKAKKKTICTFPTRLADVMVQWKARVRVETTIHRTAR